MRGSGRTTHTACGLYLLGEARRKGIKECERSTDVARLVLARKGKKFLGLNNRGEGDRLH